MNWKTTALGVLLAGIAIVGPLAAYAGVQVVYPSSTHTVNVNTSPPISFAAGADYAQANSLGFASVFTATDSNAGFTITLSGLSGGSLIIDKYVTITATAAITSFNVTIAAAVAGTLDAAELVVLKLRLWTGGTAPVADGSAGVCAVLDLEAALNIGSTASCNGNQSVFMQITYQLASASAGSSTVSIRPGAIVFA